MFHSNFNSGSWRSSESESDEFYPADEDFDSEDGLSDGEKCHCRIQHAQKWE